MIMAWGAMIAGWVRGRPDVAGDAPIRRSSPGCAWAN
jgi:hypothetical protein